MGIRQGRKSGRPGCGNFEGREAILIILSTDCLDLAIHLCVGFTRAEPGHRIIGPSREHACSSLHFSVSNGEAVLFKVLESGVLEFEELTALRNRGRELQIEGAVGNHGKKWTLDGSIVAEA